MEKIGDAQEQKGNAYIFSWVKTKITNLNANFCSKVNDLLI
jgi:hypothetical protein